MSCKSPDSSGKRKNAEERGVEYYMKSQMITNPDRAAICQDIVDVLQRNTNYCRNIKAQNVREDTPGSDNCLTMT